MDIGEGISRRGCIEHLRPGAAYKDPGGCAPWQAATTAFGPPDTGPKDSAAIPRLPTGWRPSERHPRPRLTEGATDGTVEGGTEGDREGGCVGGTVGAVVGVREGDTEGDSDGNPLGALVGAVVGP
jgi:hypothetical protein